MAVPKRKVSRARRDKRRSQVWKLSAPSFSRCKQCGELKLAHRPIHVDARPYSQPNCPA